MNSQSKTHIPGCDCDQCLSGSSASTKPNVTACTKAELDLIQEIAIRYECIKHERGESSFNPLGESTIYLLMVAHRDVAALDLEKILGLEKSLLVTTVEAVVENGQVRGAAIKDCCTANDADYHLAPQSKRLDFDAAQLLAEAIRAKLDSADGLMQAQNAKQVLIELSDGNDNHALKYLNKLTPASKRNLQRTVESINGFMRLYCDDSARIQQPIEVVA